MKNEKEIKKMKKHIKSMATRLRKIKAFETAQIFDARALMLEWVLGDS